MKCLVWLVYSFYYLLSIFKSSLTRSIITTPMIVEMFYFALTETQASSLTIANDTKTANGSSQTNISIPSQISKYKDLLLSLFDRM